MKKLFILFAFCLLLSSFGFAWQQRVAYDIDVKLDTAAHWLHGSERLTYWNNSPDTLHTVWFHLYPNAYKDLGTALAVEAESFHDYRGRCLAERDRGFIEISSFRAGGAALALRPGADITTACCDLPAPLVPGDSLMFDIVFGVKLPAIVSRLGHKGAHYEISQWYPKIVVYDEKGWHPDGYRYIGEFYGDYGSFNVGIWTPQGMMVGATGVKVIDTANSDSTSSDSTDYHLFCADNVHDFAWCADRTYVVTEEEHDGVLIKVMALPRDTVKWKNVMQYSKDALDYYGHWYGRYPYSTLTVCQGSLAAGGGMEYPNLVIVSSGEDRFTRSLEMVVIHEIGHQWFYGALGNDEMDEAWLDEGINTFSEERYFEEKYGSAGNLLAKPRARRWLPELSDRYIGRMMYAMFALNRMEQPVLTRACDIREPTLYAVTAYKKPALMMWWLRDYLGDESFDRAMRAYCAKYQFKHVTTEKFLAVVDSVAKEDVRPYFMPMLTTTQRCDYAIAAVERVEEQENIYRISLQRRDSLVLPVSLRLKDAVSERYTVGWSGAGADTTFCLRTDGELRHAVLDPAASLPEVKRFDNHWPRQWSFTLLPRLPSFDKYQMWAVPLPWYDGINGFRFGPILHGGYLVDGGPLVGLHQWTASSYYGFRSRQLSWSLDYQTPVTRLPMPPRVYGTFGKAYDTYWAGAGIRRSWGKALMAPTERFDARLDYSRVVNVTRFWDRRDIERGETWAVTGERRFAATGWRYGSSLRLAAAAGLSNTPHSGMRNYMRAEAEERAYLRLGKYVRIDARGIIGQISGDPPAQEQYFLSGGFKATGLDNMIVSYTGWFSPQERYHIDGGANLPGYAGRHVRGTSVLAAGLSLPLHRTPVALFCGAGQVINDWSELHPGRVPANAGVDLRLPGVRLLLPLWINQPLPREKKLAWRWKVSISTTMSIG